ncbi:MULTISPECIES: hypothetical protein [Brasilonema]|uniref:hypothetical protein n=1 Tax=Brasilonema TaxID=383614 RepID=UPI00145E30B5|nr:MULTISPECIES: hypothetical protein [Brasilonema]
MCSLPLLYQFTLWLTPRLTAIGYVFDTPERTAHAAWANGERSRLCRETLIKHWSNQLKPNSYSRR